MSVAHGDSTPECPHAWRATLIGASSFSRRQHRRWTRQGEGHKGERPASAWRRLCDARPGLTNAVCAWLCTTRSTWLPRCRMRRFQMISGLRESSSVCVRDGTLIERRARDAKDALRVLTLHVSSSVPTRRRARVSLSSLCAACRRVTPPSRETCVRRAICDFLRIAVISALGRGPRVRCKCVT